MDRNGKKKKAESADDHAERSDTKSQNKDTIGRMQADAKLQKGRGGEAPAAGGGKKGNRG